MIRCESTAGLFGTRVRLTVEPRSAASARAYTAYRPSVTSRPDSHTHLAGDSTSRPRTRQT